MIGHKSHKILRVRQQVQGGPRAAIHLVAYSSVIVERYTFRSESQRQWNQVVGVTLPRCPSVEVAAARREVPSTGLTLGPCNLSII